MKFYEFDEMQKRVDIFNERFYPRKIGKELKWYRNVTTILGIIDKGYNYDEWLKNVGHNAEIILDRSGKFGTDSHKLNEFFLNGNNVKFFDVQGEQQYTTAIWERFNIWVEWYKEAKINPVFTETIVYSDKYEYAGTVDCIGKLDNEIYLFDWKTGNYLSKEADLQMVAYMRAYEEMSGVRVREANIVHYPLKKPNKKGYMIHKVENSDRLFDLFLKAKDLFDWKNADKPKLLTLPLEISKEITNGF